MTDDPDFAKLARDFMDLWQEQAAAAATDPALAKWTEAWMAPMTAAIEAARRDGGTDTAGTAPPASPSDDVLRRMDEFAGRLDAYEKRLAAVERKSRAKGRRDPDNDRGSRR